MTEKQIVTRFPPSPTGFLHIGRARTALYNYLFAKKHQGKMVFRIEDTDKERSKKEFENNIIESLEWLGITYDEGPFRQSEREDVYKKYLKKLIDDGFAYLSQEKPEENADPAEKQKRTEVIRFKNPNKKITFTDLIRGVIEFDTTDLGDFVIAKSLEEPLYHLAVVVDDFEMGITHILRGEDGISNTPRQILIQEGISAPRPLYAHIPLILAPDRSKLSGRHGAVSVTEYKDKGYLPEALINYLALLGWNPGTEQEIFSMDDLIAQFDIEKVQKSGAIFNEEKLKWINKEHIKKLSPETLEKAVRPLLEKKYAVSAEQYAKIVPIILERISTFGELSLMIDSGEFDYFFMTPSFDLSNLLWKGKGDLATAKKHLSEVIVRLEKVSESGFTKESVKEAIWPYAEEVGRGDVLWPTRFSLSGKDKSPDPFVLAEVLGKTETLTRLQAVVAKL
jgi:glutamyl-tRNA synthetase